MSGARARRLIRAVMFLRGQFWNSFMRVLAVVVSWARLWGVVGRAVGDAAGGAVGGAGDCKADRAARQRPDEFGPAGR